MPYDRVSELPAVIRENLPLEAAEIWMSAYNQAAASGEDEETRNKVAWGAVKAAGYQKNKDGKWVKKDVAKEEVERFCKESKGILPRWMIEIISRLLQHKREDEELELPEKMEGTNGDDENVQIEKELVTGIIKINLEKQIVTGIVLEPDVEDAQGDMVSEEEIEKAAHGFLVKSRVIGKNHVERAKADVVESYIAPMDLIINGQRVRKGSWVMSVKIHDLKLWEEVKEGEITGFSIGAVGVRHEI